MTYTLRNKIKFLKKAKKAGTFFIACHDGLTTLNGIQYRCPIRKKGMEQTIGSAYSIECRLIPTNYGLFEIDEEKKEAVFISESGLFETVPCERFGSVPEIYGRLTTSDGFDWAEPLPKDKAKKIAWVLSAISKDQTRPTITKPALCPKRGLVCTDGHRLHCTKIEGMDLVPSLLPINVDMSLFGKVLVHFHVEKNGVYIEDKDGVSGFFSFGKESEFPNIESLFNVKPSHVSDWEPGKRKDILKTIAKEKVDYVEFRSMSTTVKDQELPGIIDLDGKAINPKYLLDVAELGGFMRVSVQEKSAPVLFDAVESKALVMPIRK